MADDNNPGNAGHATTQPPAAPPSGGQLIVRPPEAERGPAVPPPDGGHILRKWLLLGGGVLVALAAVWFLVPWVIRMFTTVSTDDAYVNSHVTFVAARVPGQVEEVLVDDNYRVKKDQVLVRLDPKPYLVIVDQKQAAVNNAKAALRVATDQVHAMIATARSNRFKLQNAIEQVNNQVALLQSKVAALESLQPVVARAQTDYETVREAKKINDGAYSQEELNRRQQVYLTARANVAQAMADVFQIRALLGLTMNAGTPQTSPVAAANVVGFMGALPGQGSLLAASTLLKDAGLAQVPYDLDQTYSGVRQALADLIQSVAPLGVIPLSYSATPNEVIASFYKRDPQGNLDRIYEEIVKEAPTILLARTKLEQAERDLDQANLNLSYCVVKAEIDGVVTRRNVNRGNNVQAGQSLMAVRSLKQIWIDANFKETQLAEMRIGHRVEIEVDMYGSKRTFEGRITGFTMGTGQTLALLPPQNATGNFVKIVQRLPVRIELLNYNPDETPLFVGTSVTPYVYYRAPLIGDDRGKGNFLQSTQNSPPPPVEEKGGEKGGKP